VRPTRKQRKRRRYLGATTIVVIAAAVGGWWYFSDRDAVGAEGAARLNSASAATTASGTAAADAERRGADGRPESAAAAEPEDSTPPTEEPLVIHDPDGWGGIAPRESAAASNPSDHAESPTEAMQATEKPSEPDPHAPRTAPPSASPAAGDDVIARERVRYEQGRAIEARHELNRLLTTTLSPVQSQEARQLLTKIADETLFSRDLIANDPLAERYVVQSGDNLVEIGRRFDLPYEIVMRINGISDPRSIRAEQPLKVLHGPFNVRIDKSDFRLDVYLRDLFLRSYPVGLGASSGTPTGVWRVKNRLENPTYFPPASATNKQVIPAGDPNNPLGERWIGLEGVEGEAAGQEGFGIHGTIEPDSIGRAVSLGCVRMRNEDAAFLYTLLLPGKSTVTIVP